MSTTTELLAAKQEIAGLQAELALVGQQHTAACAAHERLRETISALTEGDTKWWYDENDNAMVTVAQIRYILGDK